ncbi:MAG: response regulator [Nitrospira sp.]|nr:MAG: response regulator [Nitrospira sp.]
MSQDTSVRLEAAVARVDHDRAMVPTMAELLMEQGSHDSGAPQAPSAAQVAAGLARTTPRVKRALVPYGVPAALEPTRAREKFGKTGHLKSATDAPKPAVVQALRAGAVDYLPKPVAEEKLAPALHHARHLLPGGLANVPCVRRSGFRLTIDSDPACIPRVISWLIKTTASTLPETQQLHVHGSLHELLLNAVEHGTLEIFSQKKQKALEKDGYETLLRQRLTQARFKDRQVTIHVRYEKGATRLVYRIADEGNGFDWRSMLHRSPDVCSSEEANGRGIFLARSFFPSLTYNDRGNEVTITVPLA